MKIFASILIVFLLVLPGASGCASSLKLKQQATSSLQSSATTLHDLRITELTFYNGHFSAAYTPAKHIEFLDVLDKAQVAEQTVAKGLLAWNPSDTATKPASVADYVTYARAIVGIAQAVTPAGGTNDFLASANNLLKQAQATLTLINGGK
jgi:hypothetical protein